MKDFKTNLKLFNFFKRLALHLYLPFWYYKQYRFHKRNCRSWNTTILNWWLQNSVWDLREVMSLILWCTTSSISCSFCFSTWLLLVTADSAWNAKALFCFTIFWSCSISFEFCSSNKADNSSNCLRCSANCSFCFSITSVIFSTFSFSLSDISPMIKGKKSINVRLTEQNQEAFIMSF